jgi:hypothetical protein
MMWGECVCVCVYVCVCTSLPPSPFLPCFHTGDAGRDKDPIPCVCRCGCVVVERKEGPKGEGARRIPCACECGVEGVCTKGVEEYDEELTKGGYVCVGGGGGGGV